MFREAPGVLAKGVEAVSAEIAAGSNPRRRLGGKDKTCPLSSVASSGWSAIEK